MTSTADLMQVLYAPARWADPAWFDIHRVDRRWPDKLSNRVLSRRARLGSLSVSACQCPRAQWLVAHWKALPALVYLAGARVMRDVIGGRNGVTCLRHEAVGFLSLPVGIPSDFSLAVSALADRFSGTHEIAVAVGTRCIDRSMQGLPEGWHDRIRLRLPPTQAEVSSQAIQPGLATHQPYCNATFNLLKFAASFYRAQNNRVTGA